MGHVPEPLEDDAHDAELRLIAELERLPGVVAAAVWLKPDAGGRDHSAVTDLRIHAQPGASATILANAVTRVVERFGAALDPRALRIVTAAVAGAPERSDALTGGRFLILQDIGLTREGSRVSCQVRLAHEAGTVTGEAAELDSEAGRARAAVMATLRAAEATTDGLVLGLEGLSVVSLFGRRYVALAVEAAVLRRFAVLSGIALLDPARPLEEAACLAALRAIDRWIGL